MSALGWVQPVRFCNPMTAAAETCHLSSIKASDRCTVSSGHSAVMDRTRCRATTSPKGDWHFATLSGHAGMAQKSLISLMKMPDGYPHELDLQMSLFAQPKVRDDAQENWRCPGPTLSE